MMHNLLTVIRFEVVRTIKKKSFWLMTLSFPIMMALIFVVMFFSTKASSESFDKLRKERFSFVVQDDSGIVKPEIIAAFGGKITKTPELEIAKVKNGSLDAFFHYPANMKEKSVEVYGKEAGIFDNNKYQSVAEFILSQSVTTSMAENLVTVLKKEVSYTSTMYKDGKEYNALLYAVWPGMFLVLFYILIAVFGNQMLTSTIEEKENRVIEMLLTAVKARTLIIGKILSLVILGLFQILLIALPVIVGAIYIKATNLFTAINGFDIANLPVDWTRIGIGAAIFFASFMLFTGLLVTIGAAMPTAKEASGFIGVIFMLIFGPLYAFQLFISSPDAPIVQVLSYFPLTAPIPLLLRNAVGNLEWWQALLAVGILLVSASLVLHIAVRVFKQGVLEYSRKLSFKEIFRAK